MVEALGEKARAPPIAYTAPLRFHLGVPLPSRAIAHVAPKEEKHEATLVAVRDRVTVHVGSDRLLCAGVGREVAITRPIANLRWAGYLPLHVAGGNLVQLGQVASLALLASALVPVTERIQRERHGPTLAPSRHLRNQRTAILIGQAAAETADM